MPKMIFVNLPVKDLATSTRFYEAIGCSKNEQFSSGDASSMVWSDTIHFMLLTHDFYKTFTNKPLADAHQTSGMVIALSFDDREGVDTITEAAGKAGGTADVREKQDFGYMYSRAFADPDGNVFEPVFMDMSAMPAN